MRPNESSDAEEQRIRYKIEKRHQEWQAFALHIAVYFMVNLVLWGLWGVFNYIPGAHQAIVSALGMNTEVTRALTLPIPLIIMLGWGVGLVAHYIHYYIEFGPGLDRRDREIEREIERYREQKRAFEKPKNDRRVHLELTEDGEIEEVNDVESSDVSKHANR